MILNRLGNKSRIAKDIIQHFPQHRTFIDMFFGAGGLFFSKPLCDNNFCNDIDNDVFNLFQVIRNDKDKLIQALLITPIHDTLFKHWKENNEEDKIWKAIRFLVLSNMSLLGKNDTLCLRTNGNPKKYIKDNIDRTFSKIQDVKFLNTDFRSVLKKISFESGIDKERDLNQSFIYADPPYLNTTNNYSQGFTEQDTADLFDVLVNSKIRFALSEFDHPSVLELAKYHNLEVITIGERQNMKNRRTEILVVNYESPALYSLFKNQDVFFK